MESGQSIIIKNPTLTSILNSPQNVISQPVIKNVITTEIPVDRDGWTVQDVIDQAYFKGEIMFDLGIQDDTIHPDQYEKARRRLRSHILISSSTCLIFYYQLYNMILTNIVFEDDQKAVYQLYLLLNYGIISLSCFFYSISAMNAYIYPVLLTNKNW